MAATTHKVATCTETAIEVVVDDSAKDVPLFKGVSEVKLNRMELFKYAVMVLEVPKHVSESNFDYLQSKIPALDSLYSDFIEFSENSVTNLSTDDRQKKNISEIIGVGLGLKYSVELLETNPNKLKKIGTPVDGKYLDYSTVKDALEYEIETKGTVDKYYSSAKADIIRKKENKSLKRIHLRFGTIAVIKNPGDLTKSKCVIVDDPPEAITADSDDNFETQLLNYGVFLSYILDSKYYNKFIKPLIGKRIKSVRINDNKFFAQYRFNGRIYFGECFDYRLIKERFKELLSNRELKGLFRKLTHIVGKTKFFVGLNAEVIDAINKKDVQFLSTFNEEPIYTNNRRTQKFLDKDGIIVVKSNGGDDDQLEEIFPEKEVQRRLGLYTAYLEDRAHLCGAPCKSPRLQGKPCAVHTFRENCHFHR